MELGRDHILEHVTQGNIILHALPGVDSCGKKLVCPSIEPAGDHIFRIIFRREVSFRFLETIKFQLSLFSNEDGISYVIYPALG